MRWHPVISGLLTLLTDDGDLGYCRCFSGSTLKVEQEAVVHVLEPRDQSDGHACSDKENLSDSRKKQSIKLNLSAAMGAVCSDYDFGSPLFTGDTKASQETVFAVPAYIICENGKA